MDINEALAITDAADYEVASRGETEAAKMLAAEVRELRARVADFERRTEYLLNAHPGRAARGEFLRRVDLLAEVMPNERRGFWADIPEGQL